jgi:hypothetical protein
LPALRGLRGGIPHYQNLVTGDTAGIVKTPSEVRLAGLAATRLVWITAIVVCVVAILIGLLSGTDGSNSSNQYPGFAFTDSGNSSQLIPDFASLDPVAALIGGDTHANASTTQKTETAGPQGNRGHWVNDQVPGDNASRPDGPHPGRQPGGAGGSPHSSAPGPDRPHASPVSLPKPPKAPSVSVNIPPKEPAVSVNVPKPPKAPSVSVNIPPKAPAVSVDVPNLPTASSGTSAPSLPVPQVSVNVSAPVQTPIVKVPDVSVELP